MRRTVFFGLRGTTAALVFAVLALPAVTACGGSDGLKKQVASLETQLTSVRADQDRLEERLAALELASPVPSRAAKGASPSPETVEHPRLKVIHLSPDQAGPAAHPGDAPASDAPESGGRRPSIRGTGDRVIKTGDADDESSQNAESKTRSVAHLGGDTRGN